MICEMPKKRSEEQKIDDLLDFLKHEDYSRAIGSMNTAYEEFRKGLDAINENKKAGFLSEADAARQEIKLYERLSDKAQKAYKRVLDDMPRRYESNNPETIRKRELLQRQQSELQKAINSHKANRAEFAKKAIEATKNAEIASTQIVGNSIKKFGDRATAAMGVISMGEAWHKAFQTGDFNDVGRVSASFLGGYSGAVGGAKLGAAAATLVFGAATGGVGFAIVAGAAVVGAVGGWYGSKWQNNVGIITLVIGVILNIVLIKPTATTL